MIPASFPLTLARAYWRGSVARLRVDAWASRSREKRSVEDERAIKDHVHRRAALKIRLRSARSKHSN